VHRELVRRADRGTVVGQQHHGFREKAHLSR
jgi:hypothetical protein